MKLGPKPCQVTVSQTGPGACSREWVQGFNDVGEPRRKGGRARSPRRPAGTCSSPGLSSQSPFPEQTATAENRTDIGCGSYDKPDAEERASSPREPLRPPARPGLVKLSLQPRGWPPPLRWYDVKTPRTALGRISVLEAGDGPAAPTPGVPLPREAERPRPSHAETGRVQRSEDETLSPEGITRPQPLARLKASGR